MYPRISQAVYGSPWLITAAAHANITRTLESRLAESYVPAPDAGDRRMPNQVPTMFGPVDAQYYQTLPGGIARVGSLRGIIGKRLTAFELDCGACSLDHFMEATDRAFDDPEVRSIVIDFDSPGGTVTGVAEAARHFRARADASGKTVVGFVETMACSAAQWILAACPTVVATPSAYLGSIGVYMYLLNHAAGEDADLFQAGKYKAAGLRELSEEEREIYQREVEAIHSDFKAAIWAHRPGVPESAMEGQAVTGKQAIDLDLCDLLVDTFEEMVAQLGLAG